MLRAISMMPNTIRAQPVRMTTEAVPSAAGDYPAAAADTEGIHIAAQTDNHEAVEHHPHAQHYWQYNKGYARVAAQEEAHKQVEDAAYYAGAAGREIAAAGGADH